MGPTSVHCYSSCSGSCSSASLLTPTSSMAALKLNTPSFHHPFKGLSLCTRANSRDLHLKLNGAYKITTPKILCAMNMTAGGSDEPGKLNLGYAIHMARQLWDTAPQPVKSFPWSRALENFIQLILDLGLAVIKCLYIPVLAVTSISEMSYCAHERKLHLILLPFLMGVAMAEVLKEAAQNSSLSLKNAEVPWHLVAIAIFFTLLKLPGPYYPYWGRILIPHFANGVLLRTLLLAFSWYRRPRKSSDTTLPDSVS